MRVKVFPDAVRTHTTPHHTTPHHTTPHHTAPHHTTPTPTPHHTHTTPTPHPHYTTPHHTTPHRTTPHRTTPHQGVTVMDGNAVASWSVWSSTGESAVSFFPKVVLRYTYRWLSRTVISVTPYTPSPPPTLSAGRHDDPRGNCR